MSNPNLDYSKCGAVQHELAPELPDLTPEAAAVLDQAEKTAEVVVKYVIQAFATADDVERLAMVTRYAYALNMAEAYFSSTEGGIAAMRCRDEGLLVLSESVDRAAAWVELAGATEYDKGITH